MDRCAVRTITTSKALARTFARKAMSSLVRRREFALPPVNGPERNQYADVRKCLKILIF